MHSCCFIYFNLILLICLDSYKTVDFWGGRGKKAIEKYYILLVLKWLSLREMQRYSRASSGTFVSCSCLVWHSKYYGSLWGGSLCLLHAPQSSSPASQSVKPQPWKSEKCWQLSSHLGSGQATPPAGSGGFSFYGSWHSARKQKVCQEKIDTTKEGLRITTLTRAVNGIE